jgi:hypothetical protein
VSKQELDTLFGELSAVLWGISGPASDAGEAARAYKAGELGLLRLFHGFVYDRSLTFSNIRSLYEIMAGKSIDPEHNVTAERVHAFTDRWMAMVEAKREHPEMDTREALLFVVMADSVDRVLAERIVVERWPGSTSQAKCLLEEMKQVAIPLASGSL